MQAEYRFPDIPGITGVFHIWKTYIYFFKLSILHPEIESPKFFILEHYGSEIFGVRVALPVLIQPYLSILETMI